MSKIEEAKEILKALGFPPQQQNEISALTLLALCGIGPDDSWTAARREPLTVSLGIMAFMQEKYHKAYAPNTRETVRRQVLHQFVQGRIADYNPDMLDRPINSPKASYALSEAALIAIRSFGTQEWSTRVAQFVSQQGTLLEAYRQERDRLLIPVRLPDGHALSLSPGKHNAVQAAIIEDFAPRFAPGARLLYLGDAAQKNLYLDIEGLSALEIPITEHDKLPDVILYDEKRNWLFLIEAVTSHGPMSNTRVLQLKQLLDQCAVGTVFVTAFPDFSEFKKHIGNIAWETEVWIAEIPDHLIHYNGDRFLGPR